MSKQSCKKDGAYKIFFSSLANENRLKIINTLRHGNKSVSEICQTTGFEQTMVSHNLKRLERCGMVFSEQNGKFRYYSVNRQTIKPLLEMIDKHMKKYCCKILKGKR
ncbi:MAG: metalloregulator ArsR/SmtB family transcription factor [Nanoarchaeota archaeon]|nr:metalloregulator ArsR/SmtB family transcription factor [Nanoarchaeota archaeon]MBU1622581.1 metalloregulator ArsR/SmtB family transcription factor [Nanoarchaeota archaeon]MBU1974358.1 metalloregulator ArsR/SmtB family transcription factor [Nanoarchaeota archaeon]